MNDWGICLGLGISIIMITIFAWSAEYYSVNKKIREIEVTRTTLNTSANNTFEKAGLIQNVINLNVWINEKQHENKSIWTGDLTISDKINSVQLIIIK